MAPHAEAAEEAIFTENESNAERLWKGTNSALHVKDAFHDYIVGGQREKVNPGETGTKAAFRYR